MQKFYLELQTLEARLIQFNTNLPLNVNVELLCESKAQELSSAYFVNTRLLPNTFSEPQSINAIQTPLINEHRFKEYSSKTLQALWNIAHLSNDTLLNAVLNKNKILISFKFLDSATWVPKIIDESTYELGLILYDFLNTVTQKTVLDELPETYLFLNFRENIAESLLSFKEELQKRISIYEVHRSKKACDKAIALVSIKNERIHAFDKVSQIINHHAIELDAFHQTLTVFMNEMHQLQIEKLEEIHDLFLSRQKSINQIQQDALLALEQWHHENLLMDLPETIIYSNYLAELQQGIDARNTWMNLFNDSKKIILFEEQIEWALTDIYNASLTSIHETDKEAITLTLLSQLARFIKMTHYRLKLESIAAENCIFIPDSLPKMPLNSDAEDKATLLQSKIEFYKHITEPLKIPLLKQKEQVTQLYQFFLADFPNDPKNQESFFFQFQTETHEQFLHAQAKINKDLEQVNTLLEASHQKIHHLEKKLLQLNRNHALKITQSKLTKAASLWTPQTQEQFTNRQLNWEIKEAHYNQAVEDIKEQFAPEIEATRTLVTQMTKELGTKRKILQTSQAHLKNFMHLLENHKGFYLPVQEISPQALKEYLECDATCAELIDKMAQTHHSASQWYGINWSNISNKLSYYSPWSDKSSLEQDLTILKEIINTRLTAIELELNPKASDEYSNQTDLARLRLTLKQTRHELTLKIKEQEWLLKTIALKKQPKEQQFLKEQLKHDGAEIHYHQTLLALATLKLEYALMDTQNQCEINHQTLLACVPMTFQQLVDREPFFKEQLHNTKAMFLSNSDSGEYDSPRALIIQTQKLQIDLKQKWISIKSLTSKMIPSTTINEQLYLEFTELEHDVLRLNQRYFDINSTLTAQGYAFDQLKTLTFMHEGIQRLLDEGAHLKDLSLKEQQLLKRNINRLKNSLRNTLNDLEEQYMPDFIQEQYIKVQQSLKDLEHLKINIIHVHQLSQMEQQCIEINQQIQSCKPGDLSLKKLLINKIVSFSNPKLNATLNYIASSEHTFVQEKLAFVVTLKSKIDTYNQSYKAPPMESFIQNTEKPADQSDKSLLYHYYGKTLDLKDRQGIFGDYLTERAQTFWFNDYVSAIAALTLGFWGFKSEAVLREAYLNELKIQWTHYIEHPESAEEFIDKINEGIRRFKARNEANKLSLRNILKELRDTIPVLVNDEQLGSVENDSGMPTEHANVELPYT